MCVCLRGLCNCRHVSLIASSLLARNKVPRRQQNGIGRIWSFRKLAARVVIVGHNSRSTRHMPFIKGNHITPLANRLPLFSSRDGLRSEVYFYCFFTCPDFCRKVAPISAFVHRFCTGRIGFEAISVCACPSDMPCTTQALRLTPFVSFCSF